MDYANSTFYRGLTCDDLSAIHAKFLTGVEDDAVGTAEDADSSGLVKDADGDSFAATSSSSSGRHPAANGANAANLGYNGDCSADDDEDRPAHALNLKEWTQVITTLYGTTKVTEGAVATFLQMDGERGSGYVTWGDLLDLLIKNMSSSSLQVTRI